MKLYYHPLSPFAQKVLIAFHEKNVSFAPEIVNLMDPQAKREYEKIYPLGKVPLLILEDGYQIPESSIIVEYLDTHFDSGTKLIPENKDNARRVRFLDRMFDLYLTDQSGKIFMDSLKPDNKKDPEGILKARSIIDKIYAFIEKELTGKTWAVGENFTMADCSAAPVLFYLQNLHPYNPFKNITSYFNRLRERPSFAKVLAEVAPFLEMFTKRSEADFEKK